jgi:hypothetical protein
MRKQAGGLRAAAIGLATTGLLVAGIPAALAATVSPTIVNFGNQPVGTISAPRTVTLTADQTNTVVTSVAITGDYLLSNDMCSGATLPAMNDTCTVMVRFAPATTGQRDGAVIFNGTEDPASAPFTKSALLTGIGTGPDEDDGPDPAPPAAAGGNACGAESGSGASSTSCASSGGAQGGEASAGGAPGGQGGTGAPGGNAQSPNPNCTQICVSILQIAGNGGGGGAGGPGGNGGTATGGNGSSNANSSNEASANGGGTGGGGNGGGSSSTDHKPKKKPNCKKKKNKNRNYCKKKKNRR